MSHFILEQGICTAITLYNIDSDSVDIRGIFDFFEEFFLYQGYQPQRGSVSGQDVKTTKTWTFDYTKKFLEKRDFKGIEGFWLGAYLDKEWDDDDLDSSLSVSLDIDGNGILNFYFHNNIRLFDRCAIEILIQKSFKFIKSDYGIVYQRDLSKGPGLYAYGVITGLDRSSPSPQIKHEREKIGKWWKAYMLDNGQYKLGLLRDIYPMNLLSEAHLTQPVLSTTLKEWIESSPEHGELKPLTDILWEWWVPEDLIPKVREDLVPSGIIICV